MPRLVRAKETASVAVLNIIRTALKENSQPVITKVVKEGGDKYVAVRAKTGKVLDIDESVMTLISRIIRERKIPVSFSVDFTETPRHLKIKVGEKK